MAGPGDLFVLAGVLLSAGAEALDTIPTFDATLAGAPERQLICHGPPAHDCCEQLSVFVPLMAEGDTTPGGLDAGKRASRNARINHVTLTLEITRCVPIGTESTTGTYTPPTAQSITDSTEQIHADGWALWNHLFNLKSSEQLLSLCDGMFFDGIIAVAPLGGCAGWIVPLRAQLGGYQELLGS
jgi:hypothetical protein